MGPDPKLAQGASPGTHLNFKYVSDLLASILYYYPLLVFPTQVVGAPETRVEVDDESKSVEVEDSMVDAETKWSRNAYK